LFGSQPATNASAEETKQEEAQPQPQGGEGEDLEEGTVDEQAEE
jgi:hypothetical protein